MFSLSHKGLTMKSFFSWYIPLIVLFLSSFSLFPFQNIIIQILYLEPWLFYCCLNLIFFFFPSWIICLLLNFLHTQGLIKSLFHSVYETKKADVLLLKNTWKILAFLQASVLCLKNCCRSKMPCIVRTADVFYGIGLKPGE